MPKKLFEVEYAPSNYTDARKSMKVAASTIRQTLDRADVVLRKSYSTARVTQITETFDGVELG